MIIIELNINFLIIMSYFLFSLIKKRGGNKFHKIPSINIKINTNINIGSKNTIK